jgi:transcriptional regulator with XRE-family HTH domain
MKPEETAQYVYNKRHRAGLTQRDLAEAVGVSVQTISNIERGKSTRLGPAVVKFLEMKIDMGRLTTPQRLAPRFPTLDEMLYLLPPDGTWTQAERNRWWWCMVAALDEQIKIVPDDRDNEGREALLETIPYREQRPETTENPPK